MRYEITDARTNLLALIQRALAGEEVIVTVDDQLAVRLVPVLSMGKPRQPGSAKGQIRIASDFDGPLPDFSAYA
jgi:antitoxin (DNA-binding transcriptional repressor) of toxin-antitoxin stability system